MRISGVAIGQWNAINKKKESVRKTQYKINRAVVVGKLSHTYPNGDYIIRYHNINLLISTEGIILVAWKDFITKPHVVPEEFKTIYTKETSFKQNAINASQKHRGIITKNEKEKIVNN